MKPPHKGFEFRFVERYVMDVLLALALTMFALLSIVIIFFGGWISASALLSLYHAISEFLASEFNFETKRYRRRQAITSQTIDLTPFVIKFRNGHGAAPGQHRKAAFA